MTLEDKIAGWKKQHPLALDIDEVVEAFQHELKKKEDDLDMANEIIKNQKSKVNKARDMVAMLYWKAKRQARICEVNINDQREFGRLFEAWDCFDKAYNMLKE